MRRMWKRLSDYVSGVYTHVHGVHNKFPQSVDCCVAAFEAVEKERTNGRDTVIRRTLVGNNAEQVEEKERKSESRSESSSMEAASKYMLTSALPGVEITTLTDGRRAFWKLSLSFLHDDDELSLSLYLQRASATTGSLQPMLAPSLAEGSSLDGSPSTEGRTKKKEREILAACCS